jgi:hypothetical protein
MKVLGGAAFRSEGIPQIRSPGSGSQLPHFGQASPAAYWMDLAVGVPDFGGGLLGSGYWGVQDSHG